MCIRGIPYSGRFLISLEYTNLEPKREIRCAEILVNGDCNECDGWDKVGEYVL
jgi:hypothetical protein